MSLLVGSRIREVREAADLTQARLAEKAGMCQSEISRVENGERCLKIDQLESIATALGVEVADLLNARKAA